MTVIFGLTDYSTNDYIRCSFNFDNGIEIALQKGASHLRHDFTKAFMEWTMRPSDRALGEAISASHFAGLRRMENSGGLNQKQVGKPYSAGIFPAGRCHIMSEKDLLQHIKNLEQKVLRKKQKIRSMKPEAGIKDHSRCMAYSMSKPILQIKQDACRLENELKKLYDSAGNVKGSDGSKGYNIKSLMNLLAALTYHTTILSELIESIDRGKWTSPTEEGAADLNLVISHWINRIKANRQDSPGTKIELILNRDIPHITIRECELFQIVYHLVSNAIEALPTGKGGSITIRTDISGKYVLLEVMDNGYGVRKEIKNKIFQPYYSTKKEAEGNDIHPGLGLYIADQIVGAYGGHIDLQSEQGIGTVFSVFIPIDHNVSKSSGSPGKVMEISPPVIFRSRSAPDEA